MKAPLAFIKDRGAKTFLVMDELSGVFMPPNFMSPNSFNGLVVGLGTQEDLLNQKEAELAIAADDYDLTLGSLHSDSVLALKSGRINFADTAKAGAWRNVTANGGGRERVLSEAMDIKAAWLKSDTAWVPKTGKTYAAFNTLVGTVTTKQTTFNTADKDASVERGILWTNADVVYDLCVDWYELATAAFGPETPEGILIRTIPTTYDPTAAPGQLAFIEHFSPAPSQVKLVWHAPRGQRYNIFAKGPAAGEFTQILTNVTQTSWMGEGLQAGNWTFKGEAVNSEGPGETSLPITVPVSAAAAA